MSKSKVVDKRREAFEGNRFWIGIFRTDVDFKGELGEFGLYEAVKSGVSAPYLSEFNNKWVIWCKAWQSRQAEVDRLKHEKSLQELEVSQLAHANQEWQRLNQEKDKRINDALVIVTKMAKATNSTAMWAYDLEKALRGEHE